MRHCEINGSGSCCLFCCCSVPHYLLYGCFVFREGQGFILVYAVTSRATFERLEVFRQAMTKVKRHPVFMLVGNKCDKQHEREVSRAEGVQLAQQLGCQILETSAKTAMNIERLFTSLVRLLRQAKEREQGGGTAGPAPPVEAR